MNNQLDIVFLSSVSFKFIALWVEINLLYIPTFLKACQFQTISEYIAYRHYYWQHQTL